MNGWLRWIGGGEGRGGGESYRYPDDGRTTERESERDKGGKESGRERELEEQSKEA